MKWIEKLNLAERYLGLPVSVGLNEAESKARLKKIRKIFNIII